MNASSLKILALLYTIFMKKSRNNGQTFNFNDKKSELTVSLILIVNLFLLSRMTKLRASLHGALSYGHSTFRCKSLVKIGVVVGVVA